MIPVEFDNLKDLLKRQKKLAIMFSGGLDSEVLVRAALSVLGKDNILVLTAESPLMADFWKEHIAETGRQLGIDIICIRTEPLSIAELRDNGSTRCYHCKKLMYSILSGKARERGYDITADGTLKSDMSEDRPGLRAAREERIFHPFAEAGISKDGVERIGKCLGMKRLFPSDSCLATRIDRKLTLTPERLQLIDEMEATLRPYANGRFRANFDGLSFTVEYAGIDRKLIDSKKHLLIEIAGQIGYEISFTEKEIDFC